MASDIAISAELEGPTNATLADLSVATMQSPRAPTSRSRSMLAEHLPMMKSHTSLDVTRSHAHQGRGPLTFYRSRG